MLKGRASRRIAGVATTVLALLATGSSVGQAQLGATGVGVVEYDTNETLLLLGALSFGTGGRGWSPVFGVQGYYLTFDRGAAGNANVFSIRPSVGLRNGFSAGAVQFRVGYAFVSDADDADSLPPSTVVEDVGDGVVLSGQLDYWGTGGPLAFQLLGSYNLGSESLWTRGRVTTRLASLGGGGQVRLGGEVAYLNSDDFSAVQPGGVLEWHNGRGLILGLGAGVKLIDQDNVDDPIYFRGEVVLPLRR